MWKLHGKNWLQRKSVQDRPALFLLEHVCGLQNPVILKEVGSGLNDNRKQLQKLLRMVCRGEVRNVYVTYKDRLTRLGFRYLETVFSAHGTAIIAVRDEKEEKSRTGRTC